MNIRLIGTALCLFAFSEISAFGIVGGYACTDEFYETCRGPVEATVSLPGYCNPTNGVCTGEYGMKYVQKVGNYCTCKNTNGMVCNEGMYGIPTSATATGQCTACPANAECTMYYNDTFYCKNGFYKNTAGTGCFPMSIICKSGNYITANNECKQCRSGYYCPGGTYTAGSTERGITHCPTYNIGPNTYTPGTTPRGSDSITDCYIPTGSYSDKTGSYSITQNCYYVN